MSRITEIYAELESRIAHVSDTVAAQKKAGRKVVGVLPVYAPEELVHAAGMFPVGCWGGPAAISKAERYFPSFACSIMQAVMEYACDGTYAALDGFLVSTPCDTLKCVSQNLISACPDQAVIPFTYPQNNKPEYAVRYTLAELEKVKAKLEALSGRPITPAALGESIALYNSHRAAMTDFYAAVAAAPGLVSARQRHTVAKSALFMDKGDHTALVEELTALLKAEPAPAWQGKKVVLAGILAEPVELLDVLDELHLAVVADELAQESRQVRTPVPAGVDQLERLARQWQNVEACSLVCDAEKTRCTHIAALAKDHGADGVIYCQMKFCDPEEFDYPWVKMACDEAGVPLLNLEVDQLAGTVGQARTRMQAFAEMLG